MSELNSNKKGANDANNHGGENKLITLINPKETLVKKEPKSVVVRNSEGKLVRRTDPDGVLDEIYSLVHEGEIFVREEESRIVVKNKEGKLVARRKPEEKKPITKPEVKSIAREPKVIEEQKPETANSSDLKARLLSKHSFLGRMERGEKIGVAPELPKADFKPAEIKNDDIEEIDDDKIEELEPDAEVLELEGAITEDNFNRSTGKVSSKGFRAGQTGTYISSGAHNPNEKPNLKGTNTGKGLVGDYVLATPEKTIELPAEKKKKQKKQRKPVQPWVLAVTLVGIYLVAMATYFFVGFNFGKKQINLVLYYIDISDDAKLEYYDGEQFVYGGMKMTYYYSDESIETFNIDGNDFAETTVGMGYQINGSSINALWIDSFSTASVRNVKVKFIIDNLICYVPITIHRNRLSDVNKYFEYTSLEAGQTLQPTLFGVYVNYILEQKGDSIEVQLSPSQYDLVVKYGTESYSLKEYNCFDGEKFVLPTKFGETTIDYGDSSVKLTAIIPSDGYNPQKTINLY